jgi:hypothetical protein
MHCPISAVRTLLIVDVDIRATKREATWNIHHTRFDLQSLARHFVLDRWVY